MALACMVSSETGLLVFDNVTEDRSSPMNSEAVLISLTNTTMKNIRQLTFFL